jgi:hypothetical protein
VDGQYAYKNYLDRSIGSLGDNKKINMSIIDDKLNDPNTEEVKRRLE